MELLKENNNELTIKISRDDLEMISLFLGAACLFENSGKSATYAEAFIDSNFIKEETSRILWYKLDENIADKLTPPAVFSSEEERIAYKEKMTSLWENVKSPNNPLKDVPNVEFTNKYGKKTII